MVILVSAELSIDNKSEYLIILRNVTKDSDAYTYIKPKICLEDGRVDMKAFMKRYENKATQQEQNNGANNILENLVYGHKRAMFFFIFQQNAKCDGYIRRIWKGTS